ncbi:MAG: family 14 glycosylhydrolase [Pseudomonadota bacterium]
MATPKSKSLFLTFSILLNFPFISACMAIRHLEAPLSSSQAKSAASPRAVAAAAKGYTFNVMAPLTLPQSSEEWSSLSTRLEKIKEMGAYAVSTDIWWGLVGGARDDVFDWSAYLKLAKAIKSVGLKWVPILSFHQCGGNVGDECNFPIPAWLWDKYPDAITVSEFGNPSKEVLTPWSTQKTLPEYVSFMRSFKTTFAAYASNIEEINISFGPSGELRFPSYNSHDQGKTGYPTRGGLQAYGVLARESFKKYVVQKYGSLLEINRAWKTTLTELSQVNVPSDTNLFYGAQARKSTYNRDLYSWYHTSLLEHGRLLGEAALEEFGDSRSPMKGIQLGGKVPGIHWRMASDRLAELNAGLISVNIQARPSSRDYQEIVGLFGFLDEKAKTLGTRFVLHFTCLEMGDRENGDVAASLAKTLVKIVGQAAQQQNLLIKGENALSSTLANQQAWDNMKEHIFKGPYKGITILRFDDILKSDVATRNFKEMVEAALKK